MLPAGDDPDNFIRKAGGAAYQERLRNSRPYLEYLLDRASAGHDFSKDDSRREFLTAMLAVAARIPDAAARDQFADRLAHKAQDYGRGGPGGNPEGGGQQADDGRGARRSPSAGPGQTGRTGPDLGADAGSGRRPWRPWPSSKKRIWTGSATGRILAAGPIPAGMAGRLLTSDAAGASKYRRKPRWSTKSAVSQRTRRRAARIASGRSRSCGWIGSAPAIQREIDRLQEAGPGRRRTSMDALLVRKQALLQRRESLIEVESR